MRETGLCPYPPTQSIIASNLTAPTAKSKPTSNHHIYTSQSHHLVSERNQDVRMMGHVFGASVCKSRAKGESQRDSVRHTKLSPLPRMIRVRERGPENRIISRTTDHNREREREVFVSHREPPLFCQGVTVSLRTLGNPRHYDPPPKTPLSNTDHRTPFLPFPNPSPLPPLLP